MQSVAGLVDVHVHLKNAGGLECARKAGVVALRDAGMRENADSPGSAVRSIDGMPVVISSCWALYKPGGYGSRFGIAAGEVNEIKAGLMRLKNAGADVIKVMASGMVSLLKPGTVTSGGYNEDELRFIVDEAAMLGLGVMAHANSEPAIIAAAAAGVRSIEHGFFMTDRALELMAANGVFWTPTAGALVRASGNENGKVPDFISELVDGHLRKIKQAHAAGVPLAIGTDCVLPDDFYAMAYESELSCFEQAGIARSEVMKIACVGGARLLRI